jgi:hypothetical protein
MHTNVNRRAVCLLAMILIAAPLMMGTVGAAKNYNSSKSNSTSVNIIVPDDIPETSFVTGVRNQLEVDLRADFVEISGEISIDNENGTHWTITNHFETSGGDLVLIKNSAGLMVFHDGVYEYTITIPDPSTLEDCRYDGFEPISDSKGCLALEYRVDRPNIVILTGGGDCVRGATTVKYSEDGTVKDVIHTFDEVVDEGGSGSSITVRENSGMTTLIADGEVVSMWGEGLESMKSGTTPGNNTQISQRIAQPGIYEGNQGQYYEESSYKPIRVPVLTPEAGKSTTTDSGCVMIEDHCAIPKLDGSLITDGSGGWILATHDGASTKDLLFIDYDEALIIIDDGRVEAVIPKDSDALSHMLSDDLEQTGGATGNGTDEERDNGTTVFLQDNSTRSYWDTDTQQGIVILTGNGDCVRGATSISNVSNGIKFQGIYEDPISGTGYTIIQDGDSTRITINGQLVGLITHEGDDPIDRLYYEEVCDGMDNDCSADLSVADVTETTDDESRGEDTNEESSLSKAADTIVPDDPATAVAVGTGVAGLAGAAGTMFGRRRSTTGGSDQYFKSGVERRKAMSTADTALDDYVED